MTDDEERLLRHLTRDEQGMTSALVTAHVGERLQAMRVLLGVEAPPPPWWQIWWARVRAWLRQ